MADQTAPRGELLRAPTQIMAAWLGVLLPIATFIQFSFLASYMARVPQFVAAALALLLVAMITMSMWAAIGLWKGHPDARARVDRALLMGFAANVFCCAPLSIFMSAPPYFLPVLMVTLIGLAMTDAVDLV